MKPTAILFPVLVQVFLTFVVLIAMARSRGNSLKEGGKTLEDRDVRLGEVDWSEQATKVGRNYVNQFELPVLFYAVVAFAMITAAVDFLMVGLAWVFALSRVAHAVIHVGPNVIMWRFSAFLIGVIALIAMWLKLAIHIL